MKKLISLGLALAMACLLPAAAAASKATYYNVDNQSEYIELKPNASFT